MQFAWDATPTALLNAQPLTPGMANTRPLQSVSAKHYGPRTANKSAQPGSEKRDAAPPDMMLSTSAPAAAHPTMEPRVALERRKLCPLTPYKPEAWEFELQRAGVLEHFAGIPSGLRLGFRIDFPSISTIQIPPNKDSISEFSMEFNSIIQNELEKGRFIGPFLANTLKDLIGPFQSSPLSIIPKPGNAKKFRIVQNFSFPSQPSASFPNPSINSYIKAEKFPTTWGKFSIVYQLISTLPPGSEAATRDVSEAYRTLPLHPSQWPAAVIRISDTHFCVDTCAAFGATPSAGAYGHIADGGTEIFRSHGIGPIDKWVDDHIFFRIRREHLVGYNSLRSQWHRQLAAGGIKQTGSRIWFGDTTPDFSLIKELNEDCSHPLKDLSEKFPAFATRQTIYC